MDVEGHDPGGVVQEMLDDFDDDNDEDDEELVVNEQPIEAQEELEPIALGTWQDATDEVDAYLMESDSEFGDVEGPGGDIILGDGETDYGSAPGTPKSGRLTPRVASGSKRRRSVTPSGLPGKQLELNDKDLDELNLRSPLAKRKKLVDRRGTSGLRQEVNISEEHVESPQRPGTPATPIKEPVDGDGEASDDEESSGSIVSDDDFLAAELEADLG